MIYGVNSLNMELFKDWLRRQLAKNDWTYEELAEKIGGKQSSVSQWVNGKHAPEPEKLLRLADVTHEDPHRLFNMVYGLPMPGDPAEESLSPELRELVRELQTADVRTLRLILAQLRYVLKPHFEAVLRERGEGEYDAGGKTRADSGDNSTTQAGEGP